MAISSSTIKKMRDSASASNDNKSSSSSSGVSSSNNYLGATMEKASTNYENKPLGASNEDWDTVNTQFDASKDVDKADKKSQNALNSLESLTSKKDIISDDVMDALNSQLIIPSEVTEADKYLASQLEKIQSGKTSYSDQVRDMIDKIMNREKFSYDVDTDPLFQQALASAMNSGKQAMQDTIGQASALTGGYGSTYATTAGNQAYNSFIEDAYDNLPQYYQMAMEAYQMEGEEMYRQYSMLSTEDEKEYNRNVTAYDATYQHRNQMYNEAYTQYRDGINDAFNMANLQINEHGQRVNDAMNYYNATSDYSDKLYQREYNSWLDSVNNAWKSIEMDNSDYWGQKNFDESVRQYNESLAEQKRQYNESLAEQKRQHDEQMSYNWASLKKQGSGGPTDYGLTGIVTEEEARNAMSIAAQSENVQSFKASIMTNSELSRRGYKSGSKQYDNYQQYVEDQIDAWYGDGKLSEYQAAYLYAMSW